MNTPIQWVKNLNFPNESSLSVFERRRLYEICSVAPKCLPNRKFCLTPQYAKIYCQFLTHDLSVPFVCRSNGCGSRMVALASAKIRLQRTNTPSVQSEQKKMSQEVLVRPNKFHHEAAAQQMGENVRKPFLRLFYARSLSLANFFPTTFTGLTGFALQLKREHTQISDHPYMERTQISSEISGRSIFLK